MARAVPARPPRVGAARSNISRPKEAAGLAIFFVVFATALAPFSVVLATDLPTFDTLMPID